MATIPNAIISETKDFFWIFSYISEMCIKFRAFSNKRWVSQPKYFRSYWCWKTWLLKRLKGLASDQNSIMNGLTGSKICSNQHGYHYYSLFPSIRGKLSCKKSALVWHEILRMFVNTLTTADKYYRSKIQNLQQQFQNPLPQKQNTIFGFFIPFLKCAWSLEHFQNKDEYPRPNYFRSYWSWKTSLLTRLKGLASDHHSVMNVLTGSKHCENQHGTVISLFFREFEVNWVGKCLL